MGLFQKKTKTIIKTKPKPKQNNTTRKNKMNCNPANDRITSSPDTCYTNKALMKIKHAYNRNNGGNRITANDPKKVFDELKAKLAHCDKEDCWLNELPESEKKYLDEEMFAPDQPADWKHNPNEWLSNIDILNVLRQYPQKYKNFRFIGPTPIDFETRLPEENGKCVWEDLCNFSLKSMIKQNINKIGIVFNLDEHNEPGSHWTSMFIDIKSHYIFYFDSAANETPDEIKDLVKKIQEQGEMLDKPIKFDYYENFPTRHQNGNTECGMYSLFFIITMLTGKTDFDKRMSLAKKIELFRDKKISDDYVESFRNIYFNK